MDRQLVTKGFAAIGARVKFAQDPAGWGVVLDVLRDTRGEYFSVARGRGTDPETTIRDISRGDRHLLLEVRQDGKLTRFLCGHDERHLFVAGVPGDGGAVGSVFQAKQALKPPEVRDAQRGVKTKHLHARRRRSQNPVLRQGEWFFVPAPGVRPPEAHVLRDEPLQRGRAAPHMAEFLCRLGGVTVYLADNSTKAFTEQEYAARMANPRARPRRWRVMRRGAVVYVRGRITHGDHATLELATWHRVVPSVERTGSVDFLD